MATKPLITLTALLSAVLVSADLLPSNNPVTTSAATVTVTVASGTTISALAGNTPLATYDASQIMALYSSMTSSVDDEAATAYASIGASVQSQHSVYSWYAAWMVSHNQATQTALSTVYVATS